MALQITGSFLAVIAFCFILNTPRRHILFAGLTGAVGWTLYLILINKEINTGAATFFAGCLVSFCSQLLARLLKTPVTVFVIPGILPLVPGAGMYHIVDSLLRSDGSLTSYYVTQTLVAAGMIALSIIVADSLFRLFSKAGNPAAKLPKAYKGEHYVDRQSLE